MESPKQHGPPPLTSARARQGAFLAVGGWQSASNVHPIHYVEATVADDTAGAEREGGPGDGANSYSYLVWSPGPFQPSSSTSQMAKAAKTKPSKTEVVTR